MKLYTNESTFDFGKYHSQKLESILEKDNQYLNWCLQSIDTFCITDEVFEKLNFVMVLRENSSNLQLSQAFERIEKLHTNKKIKYEATLNKTKNTPSVELVEKNKNASIQEIFIDIPEYIGFYQASKSGKIKSIERVVTIGNNRTHVKKERILNPDMNNYRELYVKIFNGETWNNQFVKDLIAAAFLQYKIDGINEVHHKDLNSLNITAENLEIIPLNSNSTENKIHHYGGSPYKGVKWNKNMQCWRTNLFINQVTYVVGYFEDEMQAGRAYELEMKKYNSQGDEWQENYYKNVFEYNSLK